MFSGLETPQTSRLTPHPTLRGPVKKQKACDCPLGPHRGRREPGRQGVCPLPQGELGEWQEGSSGWRGSGRAPLPKEDRQEGSQSSRKEAWEPDALRCPSRDHRKERLECGQGSEPDPFCNYVNLHCTPEMPWRQGIYSSLLSPAAALRQVGEVGTVPSSQIRTGSPEGRSQGD